MGTIRRIAPTDEALSPAFTWPALERGRDGTVDLTSDCEAVLAGLAATENVRTVLLACSDLTDSALSFLKRFPNVTNLSMLFCEGVTGVGFEHICGLVSLEALDLSGSFNITAGTDGRFTPIINLRRLRILNLGFVYSLSDIALANVGTLQHLAAIRLIGCNDITDAGIEHLARLPDLQVLELPEAAAGITDRSMEYLARFAGSLKELWMHLRTGVTSDGIASLGYASSIETLVLNCMPPISESALLQLGKSQSLKRLVLIDTPASEDVIADLQERIPCVDVLTRRGS